MKYKVLGRTGVQVSALCLGTMTFGKEADKEMSTQIFRRAREAGVNMIDTANVYGQGKVEEIIGCLIKGQRDELVITSKFQGGMGTDVNARGCSRLHVMQAVEATLKRLQTDRVDFYFIHNIDRFTPIEETLRVLDDLVHQGKILYPAISNAAAWQIMKGLGISRLDHLARFECIQPMYSLVKRQAEVEILPMALSEQVGVISYSPLAAGLLTGKYNQEVLPSSGRIRENNFYSARYDEPEYYETAEQFCQFCQQHGLKPAATAVAWVAAHPSITAPIIGARNVEQLDESLAAMEISMTTELRDEISALSRTPPLATDRRDEQVGLKMH